MTSHDVVQSVRRMLREKRVGHTGTLDPQATGVLVLCVGKATRIARYLEAGEKEYDAVMRLGVTTDTLDAAGRVLETRTYTAPTQEAIIAAMRSFTGRIEQQPPSYSAIKVKGVPSYRLARQGTARPLPARTVDIFSITLRTYNDPMVAFSVHCAKGVYIRSLCADLGDALGMGAHLVELVRTRSGGFTIPDALPLDRLGDLAAAGRISETLIPMDRALTDLPLVLLNGSDTERVVHGNRISAPSRLGAVDGALVRLHDPTGRLLALARVDAGRLQPEAVFVP